MSAGMNIREARKGDVIEMDGEKWEAWYFATAIASGRPVIKLHPGTGTGLTDPDQGTLAEIADDGSAPDLYPFGIVDALYNTNPSSPTPAGTTVAAAYAWVKVKGWIKMTTLLAITPTAGHAFKLHNRAIDTTGAVPSVSASNEPGQFQAGGASVTHTVYLYGRDRVTSTT